MGLALSGPPGAPHAAVLDLDANTAHKGTGTLTPGRPESPHQVSPGGRAAVD